MLFTSAASALVAFIVLMISPRDSMISRLISLKSSSGSRLLTKRPFGGVVYSTDIPPPADPKPTQLTRTLDPRKRAPWDRPPEAKGSGSALRGRYPLVRRPVR